MMGIDDMQCDPLVEDYEPHPVTYRPMPWVQVLRWLLAHGYPTLIFPTEMTGGCAITQSVRSTLELLDDEVDRDAAEEPIRLEEFSIAPGEVRFDPAEFRVPVAGSKHEPDSSLYVIETGINALDQEVAWVYEKGIPMEEWHQFQSGVDFFREPGSDPDAPPDEYPWSHWPHCALGVKRRG